jgi:hypothetical protein
MAQQLVDFVRSKIISNNLKNNKEEELKKKILDRAIKLYINVSDLVKDIRYGEEAKQCMYEMLSYVLDFSLEEN